MSRNKWKHQPTTPSPTTSPDAPTFDLYFAAALTGVLSGRDPYEQTDSLIAAARHVATRAMELATKETEPETPNDEPKF
jgi:hypothetical protein